MTPSGEHRAPTERSPPPRPWVPPRSAPAQLDFPLVRNGLDYLTSVVEHLDENKSMVTPRDVKYAVLHLQAAVEVLLKARLMAEHWSLDFSRPEDATRKALEEATLSSVTTDQAVTRLRNIAAVPITDKEEKALAGLGKHRNKLQHFGLTAPARAVEAKAGEVLDFLIRFVDEELLPRLGPEERKEVERTLRELRGGLVNINTFVKERTNRIRGEVKKEDAGNRTIRCPDCDQLALVLGDETAGTDGEPVAACRFCGSRWGAGGTAVILPSRGPGGAERAQPLPSVYGVDARLGGPDPQRTRRRRHLLLRLLCCLPRPGPVRLVRTSNRRGRRQYRPVRQLLGGRGGGDPLRAGGPHRLRLRPGTMGRQLGLQLRCRAATSVRLAVGALSTVWSKLAAECVRSSTARSFWL
ncbi:hypothetical protein [Streptomyces galilaeus]|uniref:hypothetical protein n=1 Tax=Streptomyces galilaeus TaxID=33899 RepID=UPI0038F6247D